MAERQFRENHTQRENYKIAERKDRKIFRTITLIALPIFWIGYGCALFKGNSGNISYYSLLIMAFSIMNADILFTEERLQNRALNIYAKILGILFFVWAAITVISIILK